MHAPSPQFTPAPLLANGSRALPLPLHTVHSAGLPNHLPPPPQQLPQQHQQQQQPSHSQQQPQVGAGESQLAPSSSAASYASRSSAGVAGHLFMAQGNGNALPSIHQSVLPGPFPGAQLAYGGGNNSQALPGMSAYPRGVLIGARSFQSHSAPLLSSSPSPRHSPPLPLPPAASLQASVLFEPSAPR